MSALWRVIKMKNSIILYSGGMDSTAALFLFKEQIKLALSFNYGSKHNEKELKCAAINCELLSIPHKIINLNFDEFGIVSNLLKSGGEIPEGHYEDESMKSTVVPFRNGIMLSIAAAIAESNNCENIIISNHAGDHAIYPDCRNEFTQAILSAIRLGTYNQIEVIAPFVNMTKREIALKAKENGIYLSNSYSCYKGGEIHCGKCGTCVERKEALEGFDRTIYEA